MECSSLTTCTKCKEGFFLDNNTCTERCPDATYADDITNTCLACDSATAKCLTCKFKADFCLTCVVDVTIFYKLNSCVTNCGDGYYKGIIFFLLFSIYFILFNLNYLIIFIITFINS